ncbi:hypothetical protein ACJH6J_29270 [Mycobacterium sp. SMC-18]|uniref:hypothetical protein n=1 Tax=Mycobacterium sp. SMC-18 TaxID=3381629 RepID=UPI003875C71E
MTTELTTQSEISAAFRERMRVGAGLTVPYARKWAIGGCEPSQSLWPFPHNEIATMAAGLLRLDASITATQDAVLIGLDSGTMWVAANGPTRDAERASAFLIGPQGDDSARYVGNAAAVVLEIIKGLSSAPPPAPVANDLLHIGFPGIHDPERTYVGSWRWNVHGEARDDEYVRRAAYATLRAIRATESPRAD